MNRSVTISAATAAAILLFAGCGGDSPSAQTSSALSSQRSATRSASGGGDLEGYVQRNLVSDGFVAADHTDPNLVNAWGIAHLATSPWWVSDNGTGVATLYDADGVAQPPAAPLVVSVTGAGGNEAAPTGVVANGGTGFVVSSGGASGPARFIFASEDGTISGWNPGVPPPIPPATTSTTTVVVVDNSSPDPLGGAVYKGITIASTAAGERLYASDFRGAKVDVFDASFEPVSSPGAFVDPGIPDGFAPFGIQAASGMILVTYAKQDAEKSDDVAGAGLGFVSAFTPDGAFLRRVASRGKLNAPWGLAVAPDTGFGRASGRLLVGNFGDGRIIAYRLTGKARPDREEDKHGEDGRGRGKYLAGPNGPITIDGLWGIGFGNGATAGPVNTLFFAAGPGDEEHGLFGRIDFVPKHENEDEDDD
jgi:uncharacterized protein (TIGR03118 family)